MKGTVNDGSDSREAEEHCSGSELGKAEDSWLLTRICSLLRCHPTTLGALATALHSRFVSCPQLTS